MAVSCAPVRKAFIAAFPHLSIAVALLIIVGQLIIIALALSSPSTLGLFERIYSHGTFNGTSIFLTGPQSVSLGVATIIIIIEGFIFGILTCYNEFKNYVINACRLQPANDHTSPSARQPLVQHNDSIGHGTFCKNPHFIGPFQLHIYTQLSPRLKKLVKKFLVLYVAEISFELVEFLTKWLLALLVIRGNWLSVGVTIVGGVGYPILQLWRNILHSQRLVPLSPAGHENIE